MAIKEKLTYLDGQIYLSEKDANGNPINLQSTGLQTSFKVSMKEEVKKLLDARGRLRKTVRLIPEATISIDGHSLDSEAFKRVVFGVNHAIAAGTAVTLTVPSLAVGQLIPTGHLNISNVTANNALVAGTDFTVNGPSGNLVSKVASAGPVTFTFDHGAHVATGMLQATAQDFYLFFDGYDLANNEPVVVELYNVRFGAAKELAFLGKDFLTLTIEGDLQVDPTKPEDAEFGQYGVIRRVA